MKRLSLYALFILALSQPCFGAEKELHLQNIFISYVPNYEEEIELDNVTLKGYAEFVEGTDEINLVNDNEEFVLNLKVPQKLESKRLVDLQRDIIQKRSQANFLRNKNDPEHTALANNTMTIEKMGDLSFGTLYDASIDKSQMEYSTAVFSRYEKNRFALSTAYKKTLLSTGGIQYDKLYFAPEIKLNNVFSFRDELSADITRNRRSNDLVLTISPLKKDRDRMKFEFKAGQTYDQTNAIIYQSIKFNTTFRL